MRIVKMEVRLGCCNDNCPYHTDESRQTGQLGEWTPMYRCRIMGKAIKYSQDFPDFCPLDEENK